MLTTKKMSTKTIALAGLMTALVIVLQMLGSFIHIGPFSISLVLLPIVIGAATCGVAVGTWLGFVFGVVVLLGPDVAAFMSVTIPGTIITVLLKGIACGFAAGIICKIFKDRNMYLGVFLAAIACPIVNTGVFLLGCIVFFFETVASWGAAEGYANAWQYIFLGMIGGNFLVELVSNILLSPVAVRLLNIRNKNK